MNSCRYINMNILSLPARCSILVLMCAYVIYMHQILRRCIDFRFLILETVWRNTIYNHNYIFKCSISASFFQLLLVLAREPSNRLMFLRVNTLEYLLLMSTCHELNRIDGDLVKPFTQVGNI